MMSKIILQARMVPWSFCWHSLCFSAFPDTLAALAPGAFAFVAYIVAKHFEFTLTEQYEIIFGIFLGFRSFAQGMPSPQTTKE
jgi:hypothetical protein